MCEWCADEFRKFQAPGRGEVDVCPFIGFRFPNVNGDQCTSSFFPGGDNEEPGGATDFTDCTAGPGRTYPTEASLPEWCNCTSDMFQRVVDGTTYCELDSRFNSIFKQDPAPVKALRNFTGSVYKPSFSRAGLVIPDLWRNYVGWRVAISAPPSLNVGSLTGHLEDNGFLGQFNFTVDRSSAMESQIDAQLSATGLIESFPRGFGYDDPASPKEWRGSRACAASESFFTCCADAVRAPLLARNQYGCQAAYEYARDSVDATRYVCRDCADWPTWPWVNE